MDQARIAVKADAGRNLIENDPLVAAIFDAVNAVPGEPLERIMAVQRAGQIAAAYLAPNVSVESRRVLTATFCGSGPSPSKPQ